MCFFLAVKYTMVSPEDVDCRSSLHMRFPNNPLLLVHVLGMLILTAPTAAAYVMAMQMLDTVWRLALTP
jgi:uncharacterized protein YqhQ